MAKRRSYRNKRGVAGCHSGCAPQGGHQDVHIHHHYCHCGKTPYPHKPDMDCVPEDDGLPERLPKNGGGVDSYDDTYGYPDGGGVDSYDDTYTAEPEGLGASRGGWYEPAPGVALTFKGQRTRRLGGKNRRPISLTAKRQYRAMGRY